MKTPIRFICVVMLSFIFTCTLGKEAVFLGKHFSATKGEITPELLREFEEKSREWPYIQRLYREGYFDSVTTQDNVISLFFKDPHGIGDTYFVWSTSRTQPLQGFSGLFWVSYSESRPYTDIMDASTIKISEKAIVIIPLPQSPVITSVRVEGEPLQPFETHGDLWFSTWADDDNLYCSWGDGEGIGEGTFTDMGIGCITGDLPDVTGVPLYRDPFTGKKDLSQDNKPSSLLFVDGRLYVHVHSPLGDPEVGYIVYSDDYGVTWKRAEGDSPWTREANSTFRCLFFVNMGRNYELNTDGYVYALGIGTEWGWGRGVYLTRVRKERVAEYDAYEYLVRVEEGSTSVWSSSQKDARPLPSLHTSDQASTVYHPSVGRFILLTAQDVFDAPHPWGPWTYAGSWARPPRDGWIGGYQPGIISKDAGDNSFWFTIAGQPKMPWGKKEVEYCLNLGKMVMNAGESEGISAGGVHRWGWYVGIMALVVVAVLVYMNWRKWS